MVRSQARTKSIKIQPSPAKKPQRKSKKKAWISFGSLWRIGPFQWVAATPPGQKNFPCSFFAVSLRGRPQTLAAKDQGSTVSDFRKGNSTRLRDGRFFAKRARGGRPSQQPPSHRPLISLQRGRVAQTIESIPGASHEQPTSSLTLLAQGPSQRPLSSRQARGVAQNIPMIPGASHEQPKSSLEV
jgi:hypothetical protein